MPEEEGGTKGGTLDWKLKNAYLVLGWKIFKNKIALFSQKWVDASLCWSMHIFCLHAKLLNATYNNITLLDDQLGSTWNDLAYIIFYQIFGEVLLLEMWLLFLDVGLKINRLCCNILNVLTHCDARPTALACKQKMCIDQQGDRFTHFSLNNAILFLRIFP